MVREPGDHLAVDPSSLLRRLGSRLRARRVEQERTLAEIAARAEVSISYLSAVEKGTNQPSLPVLVRIAHALDLTLADVLRAEGQNHVRTGRLDVDGPAGTAELSHPGLQLAIVTLTAEPGEAGPCPVPCEDHDVAVVVRRGALAVSVEGEEHELRTEDALDARSPGSVTWRVVGDERAVAIWTSGQAQRPG